MKKQQLSLCSGNRKDEESRILKSGFLKGHRWKGPEPIESTASIRPMSWDDAAERRAGKEKNDNVSSITGAGAGPILDPPISGAGVGKKRYRIC